MPIDIGVSLPSLALRTAVTLAVVFLTTQTAGAGSDMVMPGMHHGQTATKTLAFGEPGKPDKADRTVTIVMTDGRFQPDKLEATVGETIRFVLTNTSTLDHDFTLAMRLSRRCIARRWPRWRERAARCTTRTIPTRSS